MGRLFCYTLSARAIGATVSAGALHAQGWGFESLIAHHRFVRLPAMGAFLFWAHRRGIRTRQGAELRKREAFSSEAREERSDEAEAGGEAARDIPHRPPPNWKRSSKGDRFCMGPFRGIRTRKGAELRKRASVFQRSTRGAERRSGARAAPAARGHPSSPTTELETVLERGPFLYGPIAEGFEPARVRSWGNAQAFSGAAREERSDEAGRGRRQPPADIPHRPPLF